MTSPFVGVWELVSKTHQGLVISTETHSIHLITAKDREPFSNENEPTEAEELAAFRTMEAGGGTYSVSGSQNKYTLELSRLPHLVGNTIPMEFTIEGDKLTVKTNTTDVWRKIG